MTEGLSTPVALSPGHSPVVSIGTGPSADPHSAAAGALATSPVASGLGLGFLRSKDVDSEVAAGLQATGLGEDEEEGAGLRLNANPKVRCPGSSDFGFEPPFGRPGPRFSADGSDDLGGIARERRAVEVVRMATASRRRDKYMIKLRII